MPYIQYRQYRPTPETAGLILKINDICEDYQKRGYHLTVRQIYYQLVSRNVIPNTVRSYQRLVSVISSAREGGLIDWDFIKDRTRRVKSFQHWTGVNHFLKDMAPRFSLDWWEGQPVRCMVFVEKDALEEVVGKAASSYDVPYLSNRGYLSASAAWSVAHNLMLTSLDDCEQYVILHLGDHDPSGMDMSRDIQDRLRMFSRPYDNQDSIEVVVRRLALNMDQVQEYDPPPNPAKTTDPRARDYINQHGDDSWELDALDPDVIHELITTAIEQEIEDRELFDEQRQLESEGREKLRKLEL